MMKTLRTLSGCAVLVAWTVPLAAQTPTPAPVPSLRPAVSAGQPATPAAVPGAITPPDDYVIGIEDVLNVVFWRDKDMSADVVVRPDGKITLPLINDIVAAGLTPEQLRLAVSKEAEHYVEEPAATVVVKQINSRRVYITGEVGKPGPYPLAGPTSVLQLIAMAGGLREYANKKNIVIMRNEPGKGPQAIRFDYASLAKSKKLDQNVLLKPGDTVVVP